MRLTCEVTSLHDIKRDILIVNNFMSFQVCVTSFQEEEQEAEQLEALAVASVTSALFQYARDAKARREAAEREEDEDGNQSTASSDLDSIEFKRQ